MADFLDFIPVIGQIRSGYREGVQEAKDEELLRKQKQFELDKLKREQDLAKMNLDELLREDVKKQKLIEERNKAVGEITGTIKEPIQGALTEPMQKLFDIRKEQIPQEVMSSIPADQLKRAEELSLAQANIDLKSQNEEKVRQYNTPLKVLFPTATEADFAKYGRGVTGDTKLGSALLAKQLEKPEESKNRFDESKQLRIQNAMLNLGNTMRKDKTLQALEFQGIGLDTANALDDLTMSGNTVAAAALGIKQAKGMGEVGVMTDRDVTRYVTSGKLTQKAADTLKLWMQGKQTDATLEEIKQINSVIQEVMQSKVKPIYDNYINRASKVYGIPKEEAAFMLDVPYSGYVQGKKTKPGNVNQEADVSVSGLTQDEQKEYEQLKKELGEK